MERSVLCFGAVCLLSIAACGEAEQGVATDQQDRLRDVHLAPLAEAMSYGGGFEWFLPVSEDCRLYVREFGDPDAETWVGLHGGWGVEHSYLRQALAGLESDYHIVLYDQRGSLRSTCDGDQITVQAHVDDLETLRESLGLERLNLIAHSMGAHLAGRYLRDHAGTTGSLVLVAPGPLKMPLEDHEQSLVMDRSKAVEELQSRPAVQAEFERYGLDSDDLSPREGTMRWRVTFGAINLYQVNRWAQMRGGYFYATEAAQAASQDMGNAPWDFVSELAGHDRSVTVIIGDHDFGDLGGHLHRHWFGEEERVDYVLLEDAGHNVWIDRPQGFREALLRGMRAR